MSKLSVKKPFTVLVAVIAVVILGIVSIVKMQLDLLPNISLPYLLVITTYPGASAEKVEEEISLPMESALGTINGVKNVYSVSNENYGIVELEFTEGTDLDSAMVKVSAAINTLESVLPDDSGTPSIMELSTDMLASLYLAVSYDGKSMEELTQFVKDTVVPTFERQDGVADVTSLGLIEKTIQIELNKEKVDILNDKILAKADDKFAEALEDLDDARQKLLDSQEDLDKNRDKLVESQADLDESRADFIDGIREWWEGKQEIEDSQKDLDDSKRELDDGCSKLSNGRKELNDKKNSTYSQLATAAKAFDELVSYQSQLTDQQAQHDALQATYDNLAAVDYSLLESNFSGYVSTVIEADPATYLDADGNLNDAAVEAIETQFGSTFQQIMVSSGIFKGNIPSRAADVLRVNLPSKTAYEADISALNAEMAATKAIISGYEAKLNASGMSYETLQKAEMEASAGFGSADAQLTITDSMLESSRKQLDSAQEQIDDAREQLTDSWEKIEDAQEQLDDGQEQINDGWDQLADGQEQINDGWDDYNDAVKQYEKQKREANIKAITEKLEEAFAENEGSGGDNNLRLFRRHYNKQDQSGFRNYIRPGSS